MDKLLQALVDKAYRGRSCWLSLVEQYKIEKNDMVVLFPKQDDSINAIAWKYTEKIAEQKRQIFVLSGEEYQSRHSNITWIKFDRQQAEELMQFYALYQFTNQLIIVSLDEPEGRCGRRLEGINGITMEEIVAIGMFGLREA